MGVTGRSDISPQDSSIGMSSILGTIPRGTVDPYDQVKGRSKFPDDTLGPVRRGVDRFLVRCGDVR
jgi:hypothetical protein